MDLFGDKLAVAPGRCLMARDKDYPWRPCQGVCPKKAISLGPLEIDYALCDDCGICASVCPSGALALKEGGLTATFNRAVSDAGMQARIRCSRAAGGCAAVTCLGTLDYAFLGSVCLKGARDLCLIHGDCEGCAMAAGGELARASVETAAALLRLYGRSEKITMTRSPERHRLESDSRRAIFKSVGRTLSRFVPDMGPAGHGHGCVTSRRQRSLEIVRELENGRRGAPAAGTLPFTGKEIDAERCDGCDGMPRCVSFCPTGALEYFVEGLSAGIAFSSGRCIGCGLCARACHEGALRSFALQAGHAMELWGAKTVASFEAQRCGECERVTVGARAGLCAACRQRKSKLSWECA